MAISPVLPKLVGQRVKRREDPRLIQGRATYVDDIALVGMLHIAFKRSDVAHASTTYLRTGFKLPAEDLLNLLLVGSDNAAARALARVSNLGYDAFIQRMNETCSSSDQSQEESRGSMPNGSTSVEQKPCCASERSATMPRPKRSYWV